MSKKKEMKLIEVCVSCRGSGIVLRTPTSFGAWKVTCPNCYGSGIKD